MLTSSLPRTRNRLPTADVSGSKENSGVWIISCIRVAIFTSAFSKCEDVDVDACGGGGTSVESVVNKKVAVGATIQWCSATAQNYQQKSGKKSYGTYQFVAVIPES